MTTDERKQLLEELANELAVAAQDEGCIIRLAKMQFWFEDDSPAIEIEVEKEQEEENEDE